MSPSNPWRHPPAVPRCEKPRAEGRFYLPDGRRLGYAEFGDPNGPVVLWFHGTPGGRRQFLDYPTPMSTPRSPTSPAT